MKKLQLSKKSTKYKGKEALVDDDIFDIVNQYNWTYKNNGYAVRDDYSTGKKKSILLHRFIWNLKVGDIPEGFDIEHWDGNKLNCQISNLRLATRSENNCNRGKYKNNKSGYKGICKCVYKNNNKNGTEKEYTYWYAEINKDERKKTRKRYVKTFPYTGEGLQEAIEWQKQMEKELHQEYAFSNRPDKDKV